MATEIARPQGNENNEDSLSELIAKLHDARTRSNTINGELQSARELFDEEHSSLFGLKAAAEDEVKSIDLMIRDAAISSYLTTGEKKIAPGIEVTVATDFLYEYEEALAWATSHNICLVPASLDKKSFKDICRIETTRPEFVRVMEAPQVRIASDLGKVLEANG
jgi:hypothetical protein